MSRVPKAIFLLLVLVLLNLQSFVAGTTRVRGKENPLLRKVENRRARVHLAFCQNHRPHVLGLVLRCPRSVRLKLAQLVVDHITLLVFVLISACCVDKWSIVHQNVPTKRKRLPFHLENVRVVPMLQVVQCSIPRVMVQLSFVTFSIKSLEGFAILDGGNRFWIHECPTSCGSIRGHHDCVDRCWPYVRWWRNGGSKHEQLYTTR